MSKLRTVCVSNAFPPDPGCGEFALAASSALDANARSRDWELRKFCGKYAGSTGTGNFFPILSRMDESPADAGLWRGYRKLSAHALKTAGLLANATASGDALLLLDPTGLSALEWMLAFARAKIAIPWVDSDWPLHLSACDPFLTQANLRRHSLFPGTLIAAALVRSLYGEVFLSADLFLPVRFALFASETLRERNASMFPNLERAAVIPPAVDEALFPFAETSAERAGTWGWDGGFSEKTGVFVALEAFARRARSRREMRMVLVGDAETPEAEKLRAKIAAVPGLSEQIVFAGKIPRERRAVDFFHRIGLYVFIPRDESAFPCAAAEAMACGCLVMASASDEMRALVSPELPLLFNPAVPETARLTSDFLAHISPEEWALTVADGVARVQEKCSTERVQSALAEFLEFAAFPPQ